LPHWDADAETGYRVNCVQFGDEVRGLHGEHHHGVERE
jgi:hypothetical protein